MDIKSGNPYPSCALSNFHPRPFVFDQVLCGSLEGVLQSFKFKDEPMQREVCKMVGSKAKSFGYGKNWWKKQELYWKGEIYKRDSKEYQTLLDRLYQTAYDQCPKFRKALSDTGKAKLTHSVGKRKESETILTKKEFCSRLTNLRDKGTIIRE